MLFLFVCLLSHLYSKNKFSLFFLLITAASCFTFAATLDPFLNSWDERYHALVAKNMMTDFFKPMLYNDPVINVENRNWSQQTIWLHKQPLFLWQIAMSFKLFGVSLFTLRLPDVLLGVCLVYTNHRSGKLLINERTGILTGILTISCVYFLDLISGRKMSDHNDFTFLAYISFSIWSFIEYYYSKKKRWLVLIGLFSGFAILTKWLIGLLIYLIWFIYHILNKHYSFKKFKDFLFSLAITIIIVLPWQIFILTKYPIFAKQEYAHASLHLTNVIEGHSGSFWYHLQMFNEIYGLYSIYLILPAFYLLYKKANEKKLIISFLLTVLFVYLFFSIIATKMPSFTIILSIFILVALANFLDYLFAFISNKKLSAFIFIIAIYSTVIFRFDIDSLQKKYALWKDDNWYTWYLTKNKIYFESLKLPKNAVLFNIRNNYVDAMFYTGKTAYWFIPSEEDYKILKKKNKRIVIMNSKDQILPNYIKNDPLTILLFDEM